jgi:hypothetical protein
MATKKVYQSNVKNVVDSIEDVTAKRLWLAANHVKSVIQETLSGNRTGKIAKVPGTNKTYVQSAPGEPPAVMVGDLRRSISVIVQQEGKWLVAKIGTAQLKAMRLEYGGYGIAPRPYMKPSFEKAKPKVEEIMNKRWF